jgi:hypothetical protein
MTYHDPVHDPVAVPGYSNGIIRSTSSPVREFTDRGDLPPGNKELANDWFTIGDKRYNVHPFRADFGGYPIRWIEQGDQNV